MASFYGRAAYEFYRDGDIKFSAGGESGAIVSNADIYKEGRNPGLYKEYIREGAILNLRYFSHELTLSGGFAKASDDRAWRPYAMISYGKKF